MLLSAIAENFNVSCLPRAADVALEWRATHVISMLDPELDDRHVPLIRDAEHLVVRLRDQENPAATRHFPELVLDLFGRVQPIVERPDTRILVHCHAGVSRSTAFAYVMIAHRAGPGREHEAFDALMTIVNKPWPNRRIVEILDRNWGRSGALLAPLDAMRLRHPARIRAWRRFNERRGLYGMQGHHGRYER